MFKIETAIEGVHAKLGCYICGSPNNLIDTEMSIPYEGVLTICSACARSMALTAGYLVNVRAEEMESALQRAEAAEKAQASAEAALADVAIEAEAAKKRHRERLRRAGKR